MTIPQEFESLLTTEVQTDKNVLSVYLDVDQSVAGNLNRGFEVTLKNLLRLVRPDRADSRDSESFSQAAQKLEAFIRDYRPEGKTLALFCEPERGIVWQRTLHVKMVSRAVWRDQAYIRPILEARDEFERCCVALVDRASARIIVLGLGRVQDERRLEAEMDVHHFDASDKDKLRSQMKFQSSADEHARQHYRRVAGALDGMLRDEPFERLVLAGQSEPVNELETLLSKDLRARLTGTCSLPMQATRDEVAAKVRDVEDHAEREIEAAIVDRLLTDAAKNDHAVLGINATLDAANEGRVMSLVYAEGYEPRGWECSECRHMYAGPIRICPRCESVVRNVEYLLDRLIARVVITGGEIEQLRATPAARLDREGGAVGAFLRY